MRSVATNLLLLVSLLVPATFVAAQVPNEGLANAILAARQKNAARMVQFNWNCRTEILENGKMQDLRIDLVTCGADGQLQRTLLNDEPGKLPRGFLRKAIAQGQQQKAEQTAQGLAQLLDQYTLASSGKLIAFMVQAQVQPISTPEGTTLIQVSGNDVVVPGDTFTMIVDGKTLLAENVKITTTYNGDAATMTGTFKTLASGLNLLQYGSAEIPGKNISVTVHNYDCVPVN